MEPTSTRKIFIRIAAIHGAIILGVLVAGWVRNWWHLRPAEDTVTFVSLTTPPAPPMDVEPPPELPTPDPPPPEPKPKPKPKPQKPISVSTNRVKRTVKRTSPPRHRIDVAALKEALQTSAQVPQEDSGNDFPYPDYYDMVRQVMYQAWTQPSAASVPPGLVAQVAITVSRSGSISRSALASPSGNGTLDASVMTAVRSVPRLDPLPKGFRGSSKLITINFKLTGSET